jgi:hypothetical protein
MVVIWGVRKIRTTKTLRRLLVSTSYNNDMYNNTSPVYLPYFMPYYGTTPAYYYIDNMGYVLDQSAWGTYLINQYGNRYSTTSPAYLPYSIFLFHANHAILGTKVW